MDDRDSGTALLYGKPLSRDIKKNINAGVGFISEDRRGEGMIPIQSIAVNSAMVNFDKVMSGPFISSRKEQQSGRDLIDAMKIQPADPTLIVSNLSGGNQQKVVVGKWLQREVKLLLIDEPTVGVDIGAKAEIYAIIRKLAEKGVGIILVSSDVEELLNISTRILMFYRGKIVKEYDAGKPSQDEIMMAASNSLKEDGK